MTRPDEPVWPTVKRVRDMASASNRITVAIRMCREAWLASVDAPETDPVGTVRRSPEGVVVVKRAVFSDRGHVWLAVVRIPEEPGDVFNTNKGVKGWTVLAPCPGTPAANPNQEPS